MDQSFALFEKACAAKKPALDVALAEALSALLGEEGADIQSLVDAALAAEGAKRRKAALLIIRALAEENLFSIAVEAQVRRSIVRLAILATPDLMKSIGVTDKEQTHEAYAKISNIWPSAIKPVEILRHVGATYREIISSRQEVQRVLRGHLVKSVLHEYDIQRISQKIDAILSAITEANDCSDHSLQGKITTIKSLIGDELAALTQLEGGVSVSYFSFLQRCSEATSAFEASSSDKFNCDIVCNVSAGILEKRHPLQEVGRQIVFTIPLANNGPGTANGVTVQVLPEGGSVCLNSHELSLGDIRPGPFAFAFDALVVEPAPEVNLVLLVSWHTLGGGAKREAYFTVRAISQKSGIDWSGLEKEQPYSTEVAVGEEFVGREERVSAITARLTKAKMESCYITGQKRVGKSSLALAVMGKLTADFGGDYKVKYIEWGEYADKSPESALRNLGNIIYDFLSLSFPVDVRHPADINFAGSLAPLIRVLALLEQVRQNLKFIIVLDEFDSIHPELYRMGPLADTFFANLRSISSKPNIAFLLVGGEKMPFVISAQGDELNKFVKEELSYFSRDTDWQDYRALVCNPTGANLDWHEGAINSIFNATNGHPYFTKLLCKTIFSSAVRERDCDVTATEVRAAYEKNVASLDVNSFSHIWKDGINGSREEEEIKSLQRCRVLVAIGRLLRNGEQITEKSVIAHKMSVKLGEFEVLPILNEFCRRGIMSEQRGGYAITLPLFQDWLKEGGLNRLVADTLGDELALVKQSEEERADVKADEIRNVIQGWGPYRGRSVQSEDVRQWLEQVRSKAEQRLLFNILKHVRFFREAEIQEKLKAAHRWVTQRLEPYPRKGKGGRPDILLTYIDGPAKSGAEYAPLYAEVNHIASDSVKEMSSFHSQAIDHETKYGASVKAIIIVDDIVGTGQTLVGNIAKFIEANRQFMAERGCILYAVSVTGAADGVENVRKFLSSTQIETELHICSPLENSSYAFRNSPGIWATEEEFYAAKALCQKLGAVVSPRAPLGYGGQGLLVVFPRTTPNNSLPILHADAGAAWKALFERPVN